VAENHQPGAPEPSLSIAGVDFPVTYGLAGELQ